MGFIWGLISSRFIPAGAGNTLNKHKFYCNRTVYPRWRGEHDYDWRRQPGRNGLSPLARGTHEKFFARPLHWRFIPAGAGNTLSTRASHLASSVYPRWRGEHRCRRGVRETAFGLSPLARGTLAFNTDSFSVPRFIPAGAGNTLSDGIVTRLIPVYPRWRGEHIKAFFSGFITGGLSPLARGTQINAAAT